MRPPAPSCWFASAPTAAPRYWPRCPQLTAAQADDLHELVSERQARSLITISNRALSDWYPLFPNPVVTESLPDRLINS
ncbi:hypothetical protein ACFQ7B_40935 [Streptomyces erythrochromogenes]|uniref:hypothetical protein n=1 Tax=Streptomyces erythrochromogenes TaxID=285574 RepID=UPI00367B632A